MPLSTDRIDRRPEGREILHLSPLIRRWRNSRCRTRQRFKDPLANGAFGESDIEGKAAVGGGE
ncbi:MAG: hypothetical protein DMF08_13025 [Verrucomicrobia bacterium]|nr:MAG: hypothetical protein DMF08_13025 [Verrucomicrobiota bacterium]